MGEKWLTLSVVEELHLLIKQKAEREGRSITKQVIRDLCKLYGLSVKKENK